MRVISFRIWGRFAHFRKFWTTSSSLSYPFPPPTTVKGILGAILGFRKEEYVEKTKPFKVGVEILKPPKVIKLGLNFVDTKKLDVEFKKFVRKRKKEGLLHTQTLVEVLKEPEYRIFVSSNDGELLEKLEQVLKNRENHYTASLGWANFLANFEYEETFEVEPVEKTSTVITVIPVSHVEELQFDKNTPIGRDTIPTNLARDRKPISYESVIFNLSARPLKGIFKEVCLSKSGEGIFLF